MTFEESLAELKRLFGASESDIKILPPDEEKAAKLRRHQDFNLSAAVTAGTGGVVANGIVKLFGSGELDFFDANEELKELGFTVVAADIFGGVYGLSSSGELYYLMPDELVFEPFGEDYDELIDFICCKDDFDFFYSDYMKACPDIIPAEIPADKGVSVYPPLWEQTDGKRIASAVPLTALINVEIGIMKKRAEAAKKAEENNNE